MPHLFLARCPVCRSRMKGDEAPSTPCHRCNSNIENIHIVYQNACFWQNQARQQLRDNQPIAAIYSAKRACALVDQKETRQTLTAALYAANYPAMASLTWNIE